MQTQKTSKINQKVRILAKKIIFFNSTLWVGSLGASEGLGPPLVHKPRFSKKNPEIAWSFGAPLRAHPWARPLPWCWEAKPGRKSDPLTPGHSTRPSENLACRGVCSSAAKTVTYRPPVVKNLSTTSQLKAVGNCDTLSPAPCSRAPRVAYHQHQPQASGIPLFRVHLCPGAMLAWPFPWPPGLHGPDCTLSHLGHPKLEVTGRRPSR